MRREYLNKLFQSKREEYELGHHYIKENKTLFNQIFPSIDEIDLTEEEIEEIG